MTAEEPGRWTGALFAERYRVGRQLDRGGMGAVYEGVRVDTGVRVAIKVLHPNLSEDTYHLNRFQREAEAAAMLGHRHIVRVLDFRADPREPPYLVMEFLDGYSLSRLVKESGPLEPRRVATIGAEVLSALSAAHAAGIVHRDLKPSNIFLANEGGREVAKLVDFGIAKMMEGTGYTRMTATGALVGTPAYMPPEQALGKDVDGRADLYSLGVSLFVALTARPPFVAPSFSELIMKILREPAPPVTQFRPDISLGLEAIIAQSLSKAPEDRFQSADAMASALSPWVASTAMPTMMLPASRQPPDTSDIFDIARTAQMMSSPSVPRPTAAEVQAAAAAAASDAQARASVRGATLATNEARLSSPHLPAPSGVGAASVAIPETVVARPPVARAVAPRSSARPASTPAAFEVTAPAGRGRSRARWWIAGAVVLVVGLSAGGVGAILLARRAPAARIVDAPPTPVRPVAIALPAKVDPRKPPREETRAAVGAGVNDALALNLAHVAQPGPSNDLAQQDQDTRPRHPRSSDPDVSAAVDPASPDPDAVLTRVPAVTQMPTPPLPEVEPESGRPTTGFGVTMQLHATSPGAPLMSSGWARGTEMELVHCRVACVAASPATLVWDLEVDSGGHVTRAQSHGAWSSVEECVEPVLRRMLLPPSGSSGATYRVTLRVN